MLDCASRVGNRLNFWKTNPILRLRSRVRSASESCAKSVAVNDDVARVGASQPAQQIEKRGLAAARGAYDADEFSLLHTERDAPEGGNINFAPRGRSCAIPTASMKAAIQLIDITRSLHRGALGCVYE